MEMAQMAAANSTQYQYALSQALFVAGTAATFNLTITNPATSTLAAEVRTARSRRAAPRLESLPQVRRGQPATSTDIIQVTLPQGDPTVTPNVLVATNDVGQITATVTASPSAQPWTAAVVPTLQGNYVIKVVPIGGGSLGAQQSVTVQISITVANAPGAPVVTISESVAGSAAAMGSLNTVVTSARLGVAGNAVPTTVGLTQYTQIYWSAIGGSSLTISGGSTVEPILFNGPGPIYSGVTAVQPLQYAAQTTFTVTVHTDDNQTASYLVVVNLSPPIIQEFSVAPAGPVDLLDTVTFQWDVAFATAVFVQPNIPPLGKRVQPVYVQAVQPQALYPTGSNQSAIAVTLTTQGYQPLATQLPTQTVQLALNPAQILYFGYTTPQKQQITQSVVNGFATTTTQGALTILTVTGPGGPLTQYLGPGPYLEIQYFGSSAIGPVAPNTQVTLSWITLNAATLVLNPGNLTVTVGSDGTGSTTVTPSATTVYTLTAQNSGQPPGNQVVTSQVTVTVQGT